MNDTEPAPEQLAWREATLIEVAKHYQKLNDLEREMLAYLSARPRGTWCPGCDRVLAALHTKTFAGG